MKLKKKQLTLPLLESVIPAGFPSMVEDYVERALDLNELLIEHPAATFFVRVSGDSMRDAGIFANDILIVDKALTPVSNKIVVARIADEFTVKRFVKEVDRVILYPANEAYEPIVITPETDFEVWGVVTCVLHRV